MSADNSRRKKKLFRAISQTFIAIAIILLQGGRVWALYIQLDPSLSWQLYYEDNIAGVAENQIGKISGFSNRYEPQLKFTITSSLLEISGSTRIKVSRYLTEKEMDKTDRGYDITGTYKLNPRSEISLSATYSLNSDPQRYFTNEQGFQGGVLVRRRQDETKMYMVNYTYELSPRSSLQLMYSYGAFFSKLSNNLSDMNIYNATFSRIVSKKDTVTFIMGYNSFQYTYGLMGVADAGNLGFKMDSYTLSTGLTHQFTDSFKLDLNIGWYVAKTKQRQAVFEQDPDTGESVFTGTKILTNSTPGSDFLLLLEKKYYHTTIQFSGSEALGTNPDNGQTYPTIRIRFSIAHDITYKLRGVCSWSYYQNKSTAGDYNNRRNIDVTSYYSVLGLQYQYRRNITFSLQYSRVESNNNDDRNTSRGVISNTVYLGCTVALQRPFIVR
jgi:hypothetical protein